MMGLFSRVFVIAAEAGGQPAGAAQGKPGGLTPVILNLLPIVVILVLFFWFMSRSQRKRDRKRKEILDSIRPKDDVVTIGGIKGRVVRIDDEEVILRIDPEKDVKITISRTGIGRKLGEEEAE